MGAHKVMCLHSLNPFWLVPWVVSPKGQPPRTQLTGPSVRIRSLFTRTARRKISLRWNQPLPAGPVDASASGPVPPFPAGRIDWLVAFLQQIMSPEDYQKYKSSFEHTPLAVQLANKTKERGTVMGRIEHYRNVWRDLETKLMKQSELLEEAVERKATLQDEINGINRGTNCGCGSPGPPRPSARSRSRVADCLLSPSR